jgi:hypothetical protein
MRNDSVRLLVTQGDMGQGYFYDLVNESNQIVAFGYYRLEKHAFYYGNLALSYYHKGAVNA